MTKLILLSRSLAKAPKYSDVYVTSTFTVHVCMYAYVYTVVYVIHVKKRDSSLFNAHAINKWELLSLQDTVVFLDYR